MQLLTETDVIRWCEERRLHVTPSGRVVYEDAPRRTLIVTWPTEAPRRVALAMATLLIASGDEEVAHFSGGLFRITEMDIWSAELDAAGHTLLRALTAAPTVSLYEIAYLLGGGDWTVAHALVVLPLLFEWDACFVPVSGRATVFFSHDGRLEITTREEAALEDTLQRFEEGKWKVVVR